MRAHADTPTLIPAHAQLLWTARLVRRDLPQSDEDEASFPLAVLDLDTFPEAAALFGSFAGNTAARFVAVVEVWQPLMGDELDSYDRAHAGEPMIHFLIMREEAAEDPVEALSFRVCIVHEAGFMHQVTTMDHMGLMSAVPDGVDKDEVAAPPPAIDVAIDPGHIGYVELVAWRHRYTQ